MRLIDGKSLALQLREEIRAEVSRRVQAGLDAPCLGILLVKGDAGGEVYVRNKIRAAEEAGIRTRCVSMPQDADEAAVLNEVRRMNEDSDITGFIVQLPLPNHIDEHRVLQAIAPWKDADRGIQEDAVRELLVRMGIGEEVPVIVTQNNRPCSLTGEQVPQGAVVIDMGFTYLEDASSPKGYRIVGDADMPSVSRKASYVAPVPGGIGPMIIAVLLKHVLERKN